MAGKTFVSIALDNEADKDIIRWLDQQENRSAAVREVIRGFLDRGGTITLSDVYQAVRDLERKVTAGVVISSGGGDNASDWDEPPEAAAALNALAGL